MVLWGRINPVPGPVSIRVACPVRSAPDYNGSMLKSAEKISEILRRDSRSELAKLMDRATIDFDEPSSLISYVSNPITTAEVYAPMLEHVRMRELSQTDIDRLLDAIQETWPYHTSGMRIERLVFRLDASPLMDGPDEFERIKQMLDRMSQVLIAVSTGDKATVPISTRYKQDYEQLGGDLKKLDIENPVPFSDLLYWNGEWSNGNYPSYDSRRDYVQNLFGQIEGRIRDVLATKSGEIFPEPTGWPKVDRQLAAAKKQFASANSEELFQSVGHLCRETLISLAQAVYDRRLHPPVDQKEPSRTDAKRMLTDYLAVEAKGSSNDKVRSNVKSALDLANALQHKRTADYKHAALSLQASTSVVNYIAILSGQRGP